MIGAIIRKRSRTFWYVIVGAIAGALAGHAIGGIGVAMRGGAFRVYPEIVLAIGGAIVGYRAGRKTDRQTKEAAQLRRYYISTLVR
ncbi:outer membrane lipoprotein SlyB [Bradyrhizobium sp. AZCC 1578]